MPTTETSGLGKLNKVLVTNGYGPNYNRTVGRQTEIIDLKNPNATCPKWPDFPIYTIMANSGLLEGDTPIVCDGRSDKCFALSGNMFHTIGKSLQIKSYSRAVVIDGTK